MNRPGPRLRRWIKSHLLRRWMTCAARDGAPRVAFTFDDGPHAERTSAIAQVLRAHAARATFCCVGRQIERHPELAQSLLAEGHELINHSMSHPPLRPLDITGLQREFDPVFALRGPAGRPYVSARWIRPPEGTITLPLLRYCEARGRHIAYWNRDPHDYATRSAAQILAYFDAAPLKAGDIVLLHDDVPHGPEALDELLRRAMVAGLTPVTLSQLLGQPLGRPGHAVA